MGRASSGLPKGSCFLSVLVVATLLFGRSTRAADVEYCSDLNTGSDNDRVTNIYQSNGACFDTCKNSYAFAVVQGNACWCSNYVPGSTTSGGKCNEKCPGYPSEKCGSSSDGLYGYIALNRAPSGTQGGSSSPSQSADTQRTSSPAPSTVTTTESPTDPPTTLVSTPSTSSTSTTSTTSTSAPTTSSSATDTSTWIPTPITSVMTVTGGLQTVTITPTEPPQSTTALEQKDRGFFANAGKVAGLFVGLAAIILLIAAAILFSCWRRRVRQSTMLTGGSNGDGSMQSRIRSRSTSQLGLINDDRTVMGEKGFSRHSTGTSNWPVTTAPVGDGPASPDRRSSNARIVDQRLDPGTLWNPIHENSSRVSVRSLQDDRDYSRRVLRLANPDR
ncbi:MAG: hypothetical protein M1817_000930 [Caeruleum heppii]|nr:MAG: hypothetical protein M1817_000930 [Caeruleum heppii]